MPRCLNEFSQHLPRKYPTSSTFQEAKVQRAFVTREFTKLTHTAQTFTIL
eukprot:m.1643951 g.1643951  ORF g.1643951 m.1643951 type:complete len:50 (+) comp60615_c0_seq1:129-278(+)